MNEQKYQQAYAKARELLEDKVSPVDVQKILTTEFEQSAATASYMLMSLNVGRDDEGLTNPAIYPRKKEGFAQSSEPCVSPGGEVEELAVAYDTSGTPEEKPEKLNSSPIDTAVELIFAGLSDKKIKTRLKEEYSVNRHAADLYVKKAHAQADQARDGRQPMVRWDPKTSKDLPPWELEPSGQLYYGNYDYCSHETSHQLPDQDKACGYFRVPTVVANTLSLLFIGRGKVTKDSPWGYLLKTNRVLRGFHKRVLYSLFYVLGERDLIYDKRDKRSFFRVSIAELYHANYGHNPTGEQNKQWAKALYELSQITFTLIGKDGQHLPFCRFFNVQFNPNYKRRYKVTFGVEITQQMRRRELCKRVHVGLLKLSGCASFMYSSTEPCIQKYNKHEALPTKTIKIETILRRTGRFQPDVYKTSSALQRSPAQQKARLLKAVKSLNGMIIPQVGRLKVEIKGGLIIFQVIKFPPNP